MGKGNRKNQVYKYYNYFIELDFFIITIFKLIKKIEDLNKLLK